MLEDLLLSIEKRGRHATGIGVAGCREPFIWKWAVPASEALQSPVWADTLASITDTTRFIIGHTRYATHSNAGKDSAAHPFQFGKVIGAHNGIIYNWRDLQKEFDPHGKPWENDSQAPFFLLNSFDNPADALNALDGYWALTWTKGGKLYACRTHDANLSIAYVPKLRMLVWNTLMDNLKATLYSAGLQEHEAWELKSGVLYEFDPARFTEAGTGVRKQEVAFKSRRRGASQRDLLRTSGNYSERRVVQTDAFGGERAIPARVAEGRIEKLERIVAAQARRLDRLSAEVEHLLDRLADLEGEEGLCSVCSEPGADTDDGEGGFIHEACIFTAGRPVA